MPQAFHFDLFLYADNSGLTFQHKDVHKIEHQLKKDFANFYETVVGKKLNNTMYNGIEIKQYSKLTYLGCLLDDTMPGESMAWYPNSTQKLKKKLQIMQNKCICFRLHLDKMSTLLIKNLNIQTGCQSVLGLSNVLFQSCLNFSMAIVRTT